MSESVMSTACGMCGAAKSADVEEVWLIRGSRLWWRLLNWHDKKLHMVTCPQCGHVDFYAPELR